MSGTWFFIKLKLATEEQLTVQSVHWLYVNTQRISGYQSVGFGWLSDFVSRDIDDYNSGKHCLSLVSV